MTPERLAALRAQLRDMHVSEALSALESVFPLMSRADQISAPASVTPMRPVLPCAKPASASTVAVLIGYMVLLGTAGFVLNRNLAQARYFYAAGDVLLILLFACGFGIAYVRLDHAWRTHRDYRRKLEEYEALRARWNALHAQVRLVPVR